MKNLKNIDYLGQILEAQGKANNTIDQYKSCLKNLSKYLDKDFSKVTQLEIQQFVIHRVVKLGKSYSDENQHINAIKTYWINILHKEINPTYIKRPNQDKFIPNILTEEEIERVIFNTKNIKHRALLYTIYHNALRVSEVQNLTLMDVRSKCDNPYLIIREAKANSSRMCYMYQRCINLIREYYTQVKPKCFLFEGRNGNKYSKSSINNVLQDALIREGITVRIRVHDIRHAAATHALLNGSDIYHVSRWLGHKNLATTEKYYAHLRPDQIVIKRTENKQTKMRIVS